MEEKDNLKRIVIQALAWTQGGEALPSSTKDSLAQLLTEYPYSSTLRVLHLLSVIQQESENLNDLLMRTALSVQDRKQLKTLIESLKPESDANDRIPLAKRDPAQSIRETRDRILEEFLRKEPRITPNPDADFNESEELAKLSVREDPDLLSETLARIYAMQGNNDKARRIYERLSLKYPEKSAYFAALISELGSKGQDSNQKTTE